MLSALKIVFLKRRLDLVTSGEYLSVCLTKTQLQYHPLFNGPEVLTTAKDKAELFAKIFASTSNIKDDGVSLPVFESRTDSYFIRLFC